MIDINPFATDEFWFTCFSFSNCIVYKMYRHLLSNVHTKGPPNYLNSYGIGFVIQVWLIRSLTIDHGRGEGKKLFNNTYSFNLIPVFEYCNYS